MAEMRKGLGGMGKMGAEFPGKSETKKPAEKAVTEPSTEHNGEEGTSTITHHADGTHTSQMHGGEPMEHPDHLHLMAHIGHHLTGGDAHHVMHHDGMEEHHHSVEESGEHHEGELHGDGQEMQHEQPMEEHEMAPTYGGM
jgi:hypothetical protein